MYIDTHCHLTDERYDNLDVVVSEYERVFVTYAITMGCSLKDSEESQKLSEKYQSVYFGAGIHPSDVKKMGESDLAKIRDLARDEKCVCIGEIGLDYYWDKSYNDLQKSVLASELELAKELKLPFSFHCRDATEDTIRLLKENKDKLCYGGVMHCFSGSKETARELLNLGLKIGIGGTATFKNARNILEVIDFLSLEDILTETDSPYLSPEPYRGKTNQPKNIPIILNFIANRKKLDSEHTAQKVLENAKNLFYKLK